MTDIVEAKIVEILDQLQHGAATVGGKIVQYTPDAIQAVEGVVMLNGVQSLIYGGLALIIASLCVLTAVKIYHWDTKHETGFFLFPSFITLVSTVSAIIILSNVWTWVSIFSPKLYIAHTIVEKVMK